MDWLQPPGQRQVRTNAGVPGQDKVQQQKFQQSTRVCLLQFPSYSILFSKRRTPQGDTSVKDRENPQIKSPSAQRTPSPPAEIAEAESGKGESIFCARRCLHHAR
ncbi:hypothetical protein CLCR_10834 [Cladophialophora carrionii]|uniref:Uncharacterized protein n=1 Tax=Cladophialophora carrionii TaxID=86049 RepID=A0A1C1CXB5_9EURO|nr:hypothetical protein CLCR_10834 [Cladophialophora carrionii]